MIRIISITFYNCLEGQIKITIQKKNLYLFSSETTGAYYSDVTALKMQWKRIITRKKVRYCTLCNTRHLFISAMLQSSQMSDLALAKMLRY